MAGTRTFSEIDARIGIIRDNIRQLIEQATATSGAESEALVSDRIAQQTEELERLTATSGTRLRRKRADRHLLPRLLPHGATG